MNDQTYPAGWDADRVKRLIDHYEHMSEDELIAEDEEVSAPHPGQAVFTVPEELLPATRQLLAAYKGT
jgi:hypothetical protein